jgi:hypothetical protein
MDDLRASRRSICRGAEARPRFWFLTTMTPSAASSRTLSGAGYSVVDTGDSSEAMRLLDDGTAFDLLVADIQRPGFQPHCINVGNMAMNKPHGPKVIYITGAPGQCPTGSSTWPRRRCSGNRSVWKRCWPQSNPSSGHAPDRPRLNGQAWAC